METRIGGFRGADGGAIHTISWTGPDTTADVVLAHGYAEHSFRYAPVAAALVDAGYDVHALDHVGHGRSGIVRGLVPSFEHVVDDFEALGAAVSEGASAPRPVFLFGHSFGGLVVLAAAERKNLPIAAVLASAAVLRPAVEVSSVVSALAPVASMLLPRAPTVTLDSSLVSSLQDEVDKYDADPFNHRGPIPARTAHEIQSAGRRVEADLAAIDAPVLLIHGTEDGLAAIEGSRAAADAIPDSVLTEYEGSYHEILNDFDRGPAVAEVITFFDSKR